MVTVKLDNFDIGQICISGQCFRMTKLAGGIYEVIALDNYTRVRQKGNEITFDCEDYEYESFWKYYFDIDADYSKYVNSVDPEDKYLVQAVSESDGLRILNQDFWEMIVSFLISQQNNITRIRKCIKNICEKYGEMMVSKSGTTYYAFPKPEDLAYLPEDALMECNLGYRSKYVVRTAKEIASGEVNLRRIAAMDYPEAKAELMKMYGVGKKVADCICLFALHKLEAFPIDTHINQALEKAYADGFPFERYKGFEGVMQQYIFYHELHGEDITE